MCTTDARPDRGADTVVTVATVMAGRVFARARADGVGVPDRPAVAADTGIGAATARPDVPDPMAHVNVMVAAATIPTATRLPAADLRRAR